MPRLFQLTEDHVDLSSTLERSDIGLWCFVLNGCFQGFWTTKEQGETALKEIGENG